MNYRNRLLFGKTAQLIDDVYTADESFFRKAAGMSNQVIWTIPDAEARND